MAGESPSPSFLRPSVRPSHSDAGVNVGLGRRKTVQMRTDGTPSLKAAVCALWGPKALEGVVELDIAFEVETEKAVLRRRGADAGG